jgi:hypothetical protein
MTDPQLMLVTVAVMVASSPGWCPPRGVSPHCRVPTSGAELALSLVLLMKSWTDLLAEELKLALFVCDRPDEHALHSRFAKGG